LGYAIRSLVETVACQHLINRREYLDNSDRLRQAYRLSETLFSKLQAFRASLGKRTIKEQTELYITEEAPSF